jgi:O-antigen ligase
MVIAAVLASAGALARASTRGRVHAAGVPLLVLGWLGLLLAVAPDSVRDRWPLALVAMAVAVVVGWVLAGALAGRERWLLAAGGAFLTVRVPVPTGDDTAMLLLPLYAVIALGALVLTREELARVRASGSSLERRVPDRGWATRLLDIGAAALPVVATLSLLWSIDRDASAETLGFFLVPFVLAYAFVRSWASRGVDLRPASWALLASGLVAAAVGLVQAATRQVWWNPKVVDANRFRPDFRTNSLYWDPNIYGRALVVAILLVVAWMLVTRVTRARFAIAIATIAVLVVALWNTYSQSSWVALAAGTSIVAVLTLPPNPRRWVAAALAVVVVVLVPFAADRLAGDDAEGRKDVVRAGIDLAQERPVLGWGMGAFEVAAREQAKRDGDPQPRLTASHTTPVTVVAELGVLGALTYLTLLTAAALTILARWRRTSTPAAAARAAGDDPLATGWPIAPVIWASAVLPALVAHSLLYAGFFEDATLWVVLAALASLPVVPKADETVAVTPEDAAEATPSAHTNRRALS